jgi:hypothetical protein
MADLMSDGYFYDPKNEGCQNANTGRLWALYGAQFWLYFINKQFIAELLTRGIDSFPERPGDPRYVLHKSERQE